MSYHTIQDIDLAREVLVPPGDTLQELLDNRGMSQAELAARMDRPLKTINEIVKGKTAITPETALQLHRVIGMSADFWLELERQHQLQLAELAEARQQLQAKAWAQEFPLLEMKKLFGLSFDNNWISKVNTLLAFFQVSGVEAFQSFYNDQYLKRAAFRMSEAHHKQEMAMMAWLRQGEIQAGSMETPAYDRKAFQQVLEDLKPVMRTQPDDFWQQIQQACFNAGVRVVATPCLPKAAMNGSSRWYQDRPLIQLSNRYKRNDIFWFTFFHEAGHILLHGKKEVFIEGIEYSEEGRQKEQEADDFAARQLLRKAATKDLEHLLHQEDLSVEDIRVLAQKYETHPAIIVGRLSHITTDSIQKAELNRLGWKEKVYEKVEVGSKTK